MKWMFPKIVIPDTPKSSILIGFSIINHPFWGPTPIFGKGWEQLNWMVVRQRYLDIRGWSHSCLPWCFLVLNRGNQRGNREVGGEGRWSLIIDDDLFLPSFLKTVVSPTCRYERCRGSTISVQNVVGSRQLGRFYAGYCQSAQSDFLNR